MPRTARPVVGFRSTGVTRYEAFCPVAGSYAQTVIVVFTCTAVSATTKSLYVATGVLLTDVTTVFGRIPARAAGEFGVNPTIPTPSWTGATAVKMRVENSVANRTASKTFVAGPTA